MTTQAALQQAVNRVLAGVSASTANLTTAGARYQVYIFALVIEALQSIGAKVTLVPATKTLIARASPGTIRKTAFSHCSIAYNGQTYELHIGIEYQGLSGMTHEIDVSILNEIEASRVRQLTSGEPSAGSNRMAVECKFYTQVLGKGLARAFVGLTTDIGRKRLNVFVSNQTHPQFPLYFNQVRSSRPQFFTNVVDTQPVGEQAFVQALAAALPGVLK